MIISLCPLHSVVLLDAIRHARTSLPSLFVALSIATPPPHPAPRQFFPPVFVPAFPAFEQSSPPRREIAKFGPFGRRLERNAKYNERALRSFIRKINDTIRFLENNIIITRPCFLPSPESVYDTFDRCGKCALNFRSKNRTERKRVQYSIFFLFSKFSPSFSFLKYRSLLQTLVLFLIIIISFLFQLILDKGIRVMIREAFFSVCETTTDLWFHPRRLLKVSRTLIGLERVTMDNLSQSFREEDAQQIG